jgi:fumarylacetoacetate (FAA) hydrolase family protein
MPLKLAGGHFPADLEQGLFVGRIRTAEGPSPILVRNGIAHDASRHAATVSDLLARRLFDLPGSTAIGAVADQDLLSPIDLQVVKAAGVTFALSAIERVIEERARGDAGAAAAIRQRLEARIGGGIRAVVPGSAEAAALKEALIADAMWSQYLEVAIGPDAEIFTKAPVLSTIGWGGQIGIRSDSHWNNPEPEIVLVMDGQGRPVGATLGNDVNLRDFEGRSALLLGKAKDNNASCALGPLIRIFDESFTMDDVRQAEVDLEIDGPDEFRLVGRSSMNQISRDPEELVRQALSEHYYPDGFVLFLGTLFAPTEDRDDPGRGFTHKIGDVVTIGTPRLGRLVNMVTTCAAAPAWEMGIGMFVANLRDRGLLTAA